MEYRKCPCKECGNNLEYPAAMAGNTITCPHCGQWTELVEPVAPARKPRGSWMWIAGGAGLVCAGVVVVVVALSLHKPGATAAATATNGAVGQVAKPAVVKTNPAVVAASPAPPVELKPEKARPKGQGDLKVMGDVKLEKSAGNSLVYAVGTLTNDSAWQRFSVKVELDMINVKGRMIGKTQDQKAIIEPHQAWQFRAIILDADSVAAQVKTVTEEK